MKGNTLKYLTVEYSDYEIGKLYEETDGELEDFLINDGQLLCLVKKCSSEGGF